MSADSCSPAVAYQGSKTLSQPDTDRVANSVNTLARLDEGETESAQLADNLKGFALNHNTVAAVIKSSAPEVKGDSKLNGHVKLDGHVQPRSAEVKEWNVRSNPVLTKCVNPIRKITDALGKRDENGKEFISLAQGDPVRFGPHMKVPEEACSALTKVIQKADNNGYALSLGSLETRRYLADPAKVDRNVFTPPL